jgi:hypothetical protein
MLHILEILQHYHELMPSTIIVFGKFCCNKLSSYDTSFGQWVLDIPHEVPSKVIV